jgi:hypothetical protein
MDSEGSILLGLPSSFSEQFKWAGLQHLMRLWDRAKHEPGLMDHSVSFSGYRRSRHPQFEVSVGSGVGKVRVGEQKIYVANASECCPITGNNGSSGLWILLPQTYPARFSNARSIILANLLVKVDFDR